MTDQLISALKSFEKSKLFYDKINELQNLLEEREGTKWDNPTKLSVTYEWMGREKELQERINYIKQLNP